MKMRTWIVRVINPAPEDLQAELTISAPTIEEVIRVTRGGWPNGFIYSITTKKPKAEELRP